MDTISFKRHRFPPEIIRRAVWLYARFTLSYRDVEDLLAERGLDISYESVRRWFLKLGAPIARNLCHTRPIPNGYWHLEEMVIVIRGQRYWLWRAVDNEGEVLDFLVQSKRNAQAALKLMRKLLKKQGWTPTRITTDKLRSYHVAIRTLGLTAQHIDNKRANNRAENSHQPVRRRERKQQRFKSPGFDPTLFEHSIRRLQHLLCPAAFTQQIHVQTISKRRIQCMGKCECGRLKGNPCGPLRPNTINVTMRPGGVSGGPGRCIGDGLKGGARGRDERSRAGRAGRLCRAGGAVGAGDRRA